MNSVQQEIDCARIKSGELVITSEVSVGQTVTTEVPGVPPLPRDEGRCPMIARHAFDINGSIVVAAKSLRYL